MTDAANRPHTAPANPRSGPRRKNLSVDGEKLHRLLSLRGSGTEEALVDEALDLLICQEEALAGLRSLSGRGHEVENLYDEHLDLEPLRTSSAFGGGCSSSS